MKRIGKQTLELERGCYIIGRGSLAGKKEKNGLYFSIKSTTSESIIKIQQY